MLARLIAIVALLACGGRPTMPAPAADIAFVDVTVVPMTPSADIALPHHTVIVHGGQIVAVGPTASLPVPRGARAIAASGKYLVPGLVDMHVHVWRDDELVMLVAAGVTTIRNMWGIPQHLAWRSQLARGERFGPTLVTAGALLDGTPPDWPGSIVITDPAEADAVVASQAAAGYDFIKVVNNLSLPVYDAIMAAARRRGLTVSGHVTLAAGLEHVLDAHQRSIEHLDGYPTALVPPGVTLPSDDDPAWFGAVTGHADLARLPALIDRTRAAGTWNCATLVVYDRAPELHDVAAMEQRTPWLDLVPAATRARWQHRFAAHRASPAETAAMRAFTELLAKVLVELARADAPILVGTDTGINYVVAGEALHDEIELMVAAGVPRARVMRAATADAWRYLGHDDAGIVAVGARADLVLSPSDPRTQPLPLVPDGVMLRGTYLKRDDLEARLATVRRDAAAPRELRPGDGTRYDERLDGTLVGAERVRVDARTIRGEREDFAEDTRTTYELAGDRAEVTWTSHQMTLALHAVISATAIASPSKVGRAAPPEAVRRSIASPSKVGRAAPPEAVRRSIASPTKVGRAAPPEAVRRSIDVRGTDLTGKAVALHATVPANAIVVVPGLGGALRLAARVADLPVGGTRVVAAVELRVDPIALAPASFSVTRAADRDGARVLVAIRDGATATLVVAGDGSIVERTADDVVSRVRR